MARAANRVMAEQIKQYLDPLLVQKSLSVAEKTRRLVRDLLVSRRASADLVAAGLGVTRRTLYRKLAEEGSTFTSVLEQVRREEALRCVEDADLRLNDVAHRLGFAAQSGFSRWFRAEFNCTPREWRAAEPVRDGSARSARDRRERR